VSYLAAIRAQVANFLKRKAKKKQDPPAASLQPVKTIDKKKKGTLAETTGQQVRSCLACAEWMCRPTYL
jgi:hypothetical protein